MEQQELPLARLEAGISHLVEALRAARQEREAAHAELAALRTSARQELARLHVIIERQEHELTALRRRREAVGERLHALKERLDHALANEPTAATPPVAREEARRTAVMEELTLQ